MENLSSSYGFRSRWLRDKDPVYPCNWVGREDKLRCYQMVTSRILPAVGDDWDQTAETCSKVEKDFVYVCFQSLGRDASSRSNRDPRTIVETCAVARPYRGEGDCIAGAAREITFNYTSGPRGAMLCAEVSAGLRDDCYFGVGTVMGQLRKTDRAREADCRAIVLGPSYVPACLQGGRRFLPET